MTIKLSAQKLNLAQEQKNMVPAVIWLKCLLKNHVKIALHFCM